MKFYYDSSLVDTDLSLESWKGKNPLSKTKETLYLSKSKRFYRIKQKTPAFRQGIRGLSKVFSITYHLCFSSRNFSHTIKLRCWL